MQSVYMSRPGLAWMGTARRGEARQGKASATPKSALRIKKLFTTNQMRSLTMKRNYDRGAIMRRAHAIRRETGMAFGPAMSLAWQEAKGESPAPRYVPVPIPPQRLPLEAFVLGAAGIVRKIAHSKIEIGLRVNVTAGIRVTDSQGKSQAIGRDFSAGGIYTRDGRPRAIAIGHRP